MVVKEKVGLGLNADFSDNLAKKQSHAANRLVDRGALF